MSNCVPFISSSILIVGKMTSGGINDLSYPYTDDRCDKLIMFCLKQAVTSPLLQGFWCRPCMHTVEMTVSSTLCILFAGNLYWFINGEGDYFNSFESSTGKAGIME